MGERKLEQLTESLPVPVSQRSEPPGISHAQLRFRPDIEGLRAVAVVLVILFHAGFKGIPGGYIGVDVFFVLSGYLITGLLMKEEDLEGKISLADFYARRVRRLLPASTVMLLATCAASIVFLSPFERGMVIRSAVAVSAYASNVYFGYTARDYFSPQMASNPLVHTWSLAVEEQFYLLWPWVIILAYKFRRSRAALLTITVAMTVVSLAACAYLTNHNQAAAFYFTPLRAWEFSAGAITWLAQRRPVHPSRLMLACGWLGLALIVASSVLFSNSTPFPGFAATLPVAGTALALFSSGAAPSNGVARLLTLKPFQYLGSLSYSLYLWHWPILVFSQSGGRRLSTLDKVICLAASLALAALTHRYVEDPLRKKNGWLRTPARAFSFAAVLGLSFCVALGAWYTHLKHSPEYATYDEIVKKLPVLYNKGCESVFQQSLPKECEFGNTTNPSAVVVLFGDSHAAQWSDDLVKAAQANDWKLVTVIKSFCPAATIPIYNPSLQREESQCAEWRRLALQRIVALHPSLVVMSSATAYTQGTRGLSKITEADWERGTSETLSVLQQNGIRTALLRDTPQPGLDVPPCLARDAWKGISTCPSPARAVAIDQGKSIAEDRAASSLNDVLIVDLNDEICGISSCDLIKNGTIVYRDQNHLSVQFAATLTPYLTQKLLPLVANNSQKGAL
jgi:peptidoglycan/LPS O-acetylase OafA/YrhL